MVKTMNKKPVPTKPKAKTGPKPDVLKLGGKWQTAVRQSLTKKKPPEGWPK
jgi:hypothetical protein